MTRTAPPPHPAVRRPARRTTGALAASAVAALLLAGCGGSSSAVQATAPAAAGVGAAAPGEARAVGDATQDTSAGSASADSGGRQVVSTGQVVLRADDPLAASAAVVALVDGLGSGAHVQSREEKAASDGETPTANLTLRVPAAQVDATVQALRRLGDVVTLTLTDDDVTGSVQDLAARIAAQQISVARMQDVLSRAGSMADVVAAEQALTDRQAALEQLQAQQAVLADQVALASIDLQIVAPAAPVAAHGPTTFPAAVAAGWHALTRSAHAVLIGLGVVLPWLVPVAAGLGVGLAVRARRRARGGSGATPPAAA